MRTYSDEQIEHEARRLCQALGLDPDQRIVHEYLQTMTASERADFDKEQVSVPDVLLYSPRWQLMRAKAAEALAIRGAAADQG